MKTKLMLRTLAALLASPVIAMAGDGDNNAMEIERPYAGPKAMIQTIKYLHNIEDREKYIVRMNPVTGEISIVSRDNQRSSMPRGQYQVSNVPPYATPISDSRSSIPLHVEPTNDPGETATPVKRVSSTKNRGQKRKRVVHSDSSSDEASYQNTKRRKIRLAAAKNFRRSKKKGKKTRRRSTSTYQSTQQAISERRNTNNQMASVAWNRQITSFVNTYKNDVFNMESMLTTFKPKFPNGYTSGSFRMLSKNILTLIKQKPQSVPKSFTRDDMHDLLKDYLPQGFTRTTLNNQKNKIGYTLHVLSSFTGHEKQKNLTKKLSGDYISDSKYSFQLGSFWQYLDIKDLGPSIYESNTPSISSESSSQKTSDSDSESGPDTDSCGSD